MQYRSFFHKLIISAGWAWLFLTATAPLYANDLDQLKELVKSSPAVLEKTGIKLEQGIYQGHDDGSQCQNESQPPHLSLIDAESDRKEQITFCLKVTNLTKTALSNVKLTGISPEVPETDFLPMSHLDSNTLEPNQSVYFYLEYLLQESIDVKFQVVADIPQSEETQDLVLDHQIKSMAVGKADLILAPPVFQKTVLPKGSHGMLWELLVINSSNNQFQPLEVSSALPEGVDFEALAPSMFVGETGVYCETNGLSLTDSCSYELPGSGYPNGRIVWKGRIAPDLGNTNAEDALNKVIIRFANQAPSADIGAVFSAQATSYWGIERNEVLSDNPATAEESDPTSYTIHEPILPREEPIQIPTLSQWAMILLSFFFLFLAYKHRNRLHG